jgi:hypothetical protein
VANCTSRSYHRGCTAAIEFHQLHHGRFDVVSTGVKEEAFAYDADLFPANEIEIHDMSIDAEDISSIEAALNLLDVSFRFVH